MKKGKEPKQHQAAVKDQARAGKVASPERGENGNRQQKAVKTNQSTELKGANRGMWNYSSAFLIVVVTLLVYSNTFRVPFQLDDIIQISENGTIKHISNFGELSMWTSLGQRPVSMLTVAINYYFSGETVIGYHVFNLSIHLITGWIVYLLLLELLSLPSLASYKKAVGNKHYFALAGALLFLVHPMQTQAVTYIIQRMSVLAALFYLLSVYWYIKARMSHINKGLAGKSLFLYFLTFVSFILALLSKQNAATLPLALVLTEFYFIRDKEGLIYKKYLILCCSAIAGIVFAGVMIVGLPRDAEDISRSTYLITEFNVITRYILMLFVPIGQNVDHEIIPSVSLFGVKEMASLALILGLLYLGYYMFNKNRLVSFGIFWFFITLSVESTVIPITDYMFEHRVYLPSFGFFIALIAALFYLPDFGIGKRRMPAAILLLMLLTIPYGVAAYMRNSVWKTELSLWTDSIKKSPNKCRPYYNRGTVLLNENKYGKALNDLNRAIEIDPTYAEAYSNRGFIFSKQGEYDKAVNDFNKVIQLRSGFLNVYFNRGTALMNEGKYTEAISDFTKAIQLKPGDAHAYNNRGFVFSQTGEYAKAINDFNKALALNPTYSKAYSARGYVFARLDKLDNALTDFTKAIEFDATNSEAYKNRGIYFMNDKQHEKAINDFNKAIQLNPDNEEVYYNRGVVEFNTGKKDAACTDWKQAAALGYQPATDALQHFCK